MSPSFKLFAHFLGSWVEALYPIEWKITVHTDGEAYMDSNLALIRMYHKYEHSTSGINEYWNIYVNSRSYNIRSYNMEPKDDSIEERICNVPAFDVSNPHNEDTIANMVNKLQPLLHNVVQASIHNIEALGLRYAALAADVMAIK